VYVCEENLDAASVTVTVTVTDTVTGNLFYQRILKEHEQPTVTVTVIVTNPKIPKNIAIAVLVRLATAARALLRSQSRSRYIYFSNAS
jgi:hypothetical protein